MLLSEPLPGALRQRRRRHREGGRRQRGVRRDQVTPVDTAVDPSLQPRQHLLLRQHVEEVLVEGGHEGHEESSSKTAGSPRPSVIEAM